MEFIPLVVMFALLYFLLLRPQQKRMKEQRALIASVAPGDDVVTTGGLHGTVTEVNGATLFLEVADGLELEVARDAVSARLADPSATADEDGDDGVDDDDVDHGELDLASVDEVEADQADPVNADD